MALLPPERPFDPGVGGSAAEGSTISYELWLGEILAGATIAVLLILHWLLHRLEAAMARSLHTAQLLSAALKETAILGLVSLFLFLAEAIDSDNKSEAVHQLEVVHISLWALAASYVIWVTLLVLLSRRITLRWERLESKLSDFSYFRSLKLEVNEMATKLGVELDALADQANASSVRSYTRALLANPILAIRYFRKLQDLRYLELRERFVLRNDLPQDFHFHAYLGLCKSHVFLRLANVPVAAWGAGIWLVALDVYLRTIWPWYRETLQSAEMCCIVAGLAIFVAISCRLKQQRVEFFIFHSEFARLQLEVTEVQKAHSWADVRKSLSFHAVNNVTPAPLDTTETNQRTTTTVTSAGTAATDGVARQRSHHYVNQITLAEMVPGGQETLDKEAYKRRHREHLVEQRKLFWLQSPIFLLRLLQVVLFLVALDVSLIVVFFSDITATTASVIWVFTTAAAALVIGIYSASSIIPRYILAIHVSDLVDVSLLAEALLAIEKEKRQQARAEEHRRRRQAREAALARKKKQKQAAEHEAEKKRREEEQRGRSDAPVITAAASIAATAEQEKKEEPAAPAEEAEEKQEEEGVAPGSLYPGSYLQTLQGQLQVQAQAQAEARTRVSTMPPALSDSASSQSGLNPTAQVESARREPALPAASQSGSASELEEGGETLGRDSYLSSFGSTFEGASLTDGGGGGTIRSFESFAEGAIGGQGDASGRIARGESFTHDIYKDADAGLQTHLRRATMRREGLQRRSKGERQQQAPPPPPPEPATTANKGHPRPRITKAKLKEELLLILTGRRMQVAVTMAILLDFFLLAMSASGWLESPGRQIVFGFEIAIVVFIAAELALRIWAIGFKPYFLLSEERLWDLLDLLLVLAAVTGTVLGIVFSSEGQLRTTGAPLYLAPLLSLRLLRSSLMFYVIKGPYRRRKSLLEREREEERSRFRIVDREVARRRKRERAATAGTAGEEPEAVGIRTAPSAITEAGEEGRLEEVGREEEGGMSARAATDRSGVKSVATTRTTTSGDTPAQKVLSFRRRGAREEKTYLEATGAAITEQQLKEQEERESKLRSPRARAAIASRAAAMRTRSRLPEEWLARHPGVAPSPTGVVGAFPALAARSPPATPPFILELEGTSLAAAPAAESKAEVHPPALSAPVAAPSSPQRRRLRHPRRVASVSSLPSVTLGDFGIGLSPRHQRLALLRRHKAKKRREKRLMMAREHEAPAPGSASPASGERNTEAEQLDEEILADEEEEEELEDELNGDRYAFEDEMEDEYFSEEGEWEIEEENEGDKT